MRSSLVRGFDRTCPQEEQQQVFHNVFGGTSPGGSGMVDREGSPPETRRPKLTIRGFSRKRAYFFKMKKQAAVTMTAIAATPKATGHVGATERVPNATTADTPAVQPATVTCFVRSESPFSPVFDGCVLSLISYARFAAPERSGSPTPRPWCPACNRRRNPGVRCSRFVPQDAQGFLSAGRFVSAAHCCLAFSISTRL